MALSGDPFAFKTMAVGQLGPTGFKLHDTNLGADLVDASTGSKIRVLSLVMVSTIAVGATWKLQSDGADDITPTFTNAVADQGQVVWPYNPAGWCETVLSKKLNLVLANQTAFKLLITYEEVVP